ncbi:hypothetical protein QYE76_007277 [Lolium multiflorum]|uniref:Reverse transcriptase zinc-binding domain-containing protein n=1 Tax=Lolium multiflorum TaxID=4521 RepID=A0AAD8RXX6_LOLMU|nr:hypothetical protein QYE76_007277 [Lolium multiflorum]
MVWKLDQLQRHAGLQGGEVPRPKCRSVAEALNDGKWILDLRGRVTADSLSEFVDLWDRVRRVTLVNGVADAFVWRFSADGAYSSKSAYRLQFLGATSSPFVKLIWSATAAPKCRFFGWLFALNRLLTADRLLARRWPNSYFCPLCRRSLETALHLLVECPWARRVWTAVAIAHHLPVLSPLSWGTPSSTLEWLASTIAAATARDRKRTASTIFLVLWVLWKERNRRIFDNKDRPVAVVVAEVDDELALSCDVSKKFLALPFEVISRSEGHQMFRQYMRMSIRHANEESMTRFRAAHPELVHAEFDLYADPAAKRAAAAGGASTYVVSPSPPAGPSTSAGA